YAALSHMWGDVQESAPPLRAMNYNYADLKDGISLGRLPRNFADAVETCRRLGIEYIWIDSLCIIQDSEEDWKREAATMHMVYKNAFITIAATWATSSHDGFLARNLDVIPAVKIEYAVNTASGESGQAYDDVPSGFLVVTPVHDDGVGLRRGDVDCSKWNTRGWVMQERSLSTRTIHFCKNKIYFECRKWLKSEENEPEQVRPSDPFQLWPRSLADNDPAKWYEFWKRAVIGYSRRRLTVPSDKLTAIQSLANEMAAHVPAGSYIPEAGTWSGNMERELLWLVESGIARRPATKRAPTWSWASLD
ncbi:heterokaryon incompatibility protein-domain-containing protein, partial [Lasiosphaeria miniovina]